MGSQASPVPAGEPLGLAGVEAVFGRAAAAARTAGSAAAAIDSALSLLHDELDGAGVAVFVVEHGRLWPVGVRGYAMIPDGLPLDAGVVGRAVRTSEAQLVIDTRADPDFINVLTGVASELAAPLSTELGLIGMLNVETFVPLPSGSEHAIGVLVDALAAPVDEMRTTRAFDLSSLARLFAYMSTLRDASEISQVAVRTLGRVLPVESSRLMMLDGDRLEAAAEWSAPGTPQLLDDELLLALRGRVGNAAVFEILDTAELDLVSVAGSRPRSVVLIPLRVNGQEIGLLAGASRFAATFDRSHAETAALLSAHAAASLDAALALERERQSAHTDTLTGLLNRRGLEERLEQTLELAQEERSPLSLVVLDCDDFKDVNDRAGHAFGDALLREVGLVLQAACPEGASAARLGGDEFVVMLPGADTDEAIRAVGGIRSELDKGLADAGFPLRLSAGLATYPYDGAGASQLLRAADQALYRAKAAGKNRVIGFREIARGTSDSGSEDGGLQRRGGSRADSSVLGDTLDASAAIWAESSVDEVLERLSKAIAYVVGATASLISKVEGPQLADTARHSLRDVDLGADSAYVIADFPVTAEVLESITMRAISFLDDDLDSSEAFVLRELQMNSALLVPLAVNGKSWGLVEIYDQRLRRFTDEEQAVAWFLVSQAGRKIESLGAVTGRGRLLPVFRVPFA